jgi:hypothetical protein
MQRVLFVDVLRLLALLQMINGHTLDAVLSESARSGEGFDTYRFVRGLVSVAFLVVAGISFQLTTLVRFDQHRSSPGAVRRRLWRGAEIVLVGYLLQARWPSVYFDPAYAGRAFGFLVRCEVLQCIGLSLLALELITLSCRSARQVVWLASALALISFALAPLGQLYSEQPGASLLRGLLGHGQGSQFPIFPWSGYVFAGVVLGHVALPHSGLTPLSRRVGGLMLMGLLALVSSRLCLSYWSTPGVLASSVPWFVLEKLAAISFVLVLLALCAHRLRRLPQALNLLGGETLAIFVFHLQVIYGGSWALGRVFARSLPWSAALAASLANLILSVAFAFVWRALKQRLPGLRERAQQRMSAFLRLIAAQGSPNT